MGFSLFKSFFQEEKEGNEEPTGKEGEKERETVTIIELTLISINNITRSTDALGKIDPYVKIYGNGQLLGRTKTVDNATSAAINELFRFMPKGNPREMTYKFVLWDTDDIGADDQVGSGVFNSGTEECLEEQTVYLKCKGEEIGSVSINVVFKDIYLV